MPKCLQTQLATECARRYPHAVEHIGQFLVHPMNFIGFQLRYIVNSFNEPAGHRKRLDGYLDVAGAED